LRFQRFNKGKAISAAKSNNVYAGALWKPDAQLILEQNRRQLQNNNKFETGRLFQIWWAKK
jgi:hypothetical protein